MTKRDSMPPVRPPPTRLTLIGALVQGIRWEEFVAAYGPVIFLWARRDFGLQSSDAEDVCQDVILRVWRHLRGYDASRGRFRNWLYACVRNAVRNWHQGRPDKGVSDGPVKCKSLEEFVAAAAPPPSNLETAVRCLEEEGFTHEELQEVVARVRQRVQPATWKAFLLFECFAMKAREIGPRLGMTPVAVNQAVHRVRGLLQDTRATVHGSSVRGELRS
jgi:RNA polymerase sigma-70 factor (ECF subfamily)